MAAKKKKPNSKPKSKPKGRRRSNTKRRVSTKAQDEKLCMTKGQLMNVVIAAEVEGYKDAKKKRKAPKCCPRAMQFIRELKTEVKRRIS